MFQKPFLTLLILYVFYLWFNSFSRSVLPVHFLKEGLSLESMVLGFVYTFLSQILLILISKKLFSKKSWILATTLNFIFVIMSIKIYSPFQYYLASFVSGSSLALFFIFYNIAHYKYTSQDNIGHSSGIMFSLMTVVGIVAPILSGIIIQVNINIFWLATLVFYLFTIGLVKFQKNFSVTFNFKKSLAEIKSTRILIFLEGIWEILVFAIIPIYSLFFIKSPLDYGIYLAYLSAVGAVANLLLGKLTDKLKRRVIFLYPLTIILIFATLLFPFATRDLYLWIVLTGIVQFTLPLFWNISTAMVVDQSPNLDVSIPGRELVLACGRFIGAILAAISFFTEKNPFYIFFLLAFIFLLYPINLFLNSKVKKDYKYL